MFQAAHKKWIDDSITKSENKRQKKWTESIAVGSDKFVNKTLDQLGSLAKGRKIIRDEETFEIREEVESYNPVFEGKKCNIDYYNTFFWP